jgi:hypothetical protein
MANGWKAKDRYMNHSWYSSGLIRDVDSHLSASMLDVLGFLGVLLCMALLAFLDL